MAGLAGSEWRGGERERERERAAGEIRKCLRCELPRVVRAVLLKTAQRAPRAKVSRTKARRINARRGGQSTLANDIRRRVPVEGYLRAIRFPSSDLPRARGSRLSMQPSDSRIRRGSALSAKADALLRCRVPPGPPRSFSDRDARVGGIAREGKPRGMWTCVCASVWDYVRGRGKER